MLSLFRTKKSLLKKKKYLDSDRLLRHARNSEAFKVQPTLFEEKKVASEMVKSGEIDYEAVKKKALDFIFDKNWKIRNIGVKLFGEIRCKDGVQSLCNMLSDRKEIGFIRRNSAKALGMIGLNTQNAIEALSESVNDNYWEIRTEAIKSLGLLAGKKSEIEAILLTRLLGKNFHNELSGNEKTRINFREKNFEVREAIAENMGRVGVSKNAVLALKYLLKDDIWMVRAKALRSLSLMMGNDNEEFRKITSGVDLTCESFVPVFPLKEVFSEIVVNNRVKK